MFLTSPQQVLLISPTPEQTMTVGGTAATLRRQVSSVDEPRVKTGLAGATSNLVNVIVGSGIIGLPYALRESGLVVGVFLLVLVSYLTDKSLRMIVEMATHHPDLKHLHVRTFEDLMSVPFGLAGRRFILTSMLILAYGAMVSYLIIIKDTVPTVLGLSHSFVDRELVMIGISLVTLLPLSMMRDISQLAYTSSLSVVADVILVITLLVYSPVRETVGENGGLGQVLRDHWGHTRVFIGLGVLSTAMACQHSCFLISTTLREPTAVRWAQVTRTSLTIAATLSLVFAVTGYLGYLTETEGDILNNFDPNSRAVNCGRTLLAITMVFTYPLESFVLRHVLAQLLLKGTFDEGTEVSRTPHPHGEDDQLSPTRISTTAYTTTTKTCGVLGRRERWSLYIYLATIIPAMIFDDVGPVLSITGSLGASCLAYVAPGLCYLGLNGDAFLDWIVPKGFSGGEGGRSPTPKNATPAEMELPVVGDATAQMVMATTTNIDMTDTSTRVASHTKKPWWWLVTLMPIWIMIATSGSRSTRQFLSEFPSPPSAETSPHHWNEVVGHRKRDFVVSCFFLLCLVSRRPFWG